MPVLKKYDKDLKRDIKVTTSNKSEITQLKHEGFVEEKTKRESTQQSTSQSPSAGKSKK